MDKKKLVPIIFIVLILILVVVAWVMAGGQEDGDADKWSSDPPPALEWFQKTVDSMFGPAVPVKLASITSPTNCVQPGNNKRAATVRVGTPCKIVVPALSGTTIRNLVVTLKSGTSAQIMFQGKGGLPGEGKTIDIPKTMETEDGPQENRDADLRVPEDGADVEMTCVAGDQCVFEITAPKKS